MATPEWGRVKEIVDAALDSGADERVSCVQRMCGRDLALRTEVEAVLVAIAQSGGFIEGTALQSLARNTLEPGQAFGVYEVLELLGVGGMGEVYRARDTRLNREVALKVSSDVPILDHDQLWRLTREAQVLASLNHPNIAAIYGLEESDDIRALVLELVDGPTLADRVVRGSVPVNEALTIARQIADGMNAAHKQGIIHRDLKPSNIKLRPEGTVKILDFGLAKALDRADAASIAPTPADASTWVVTHSSAVFGTAPYMSPEQTQGIAVDKRTDIWAFGCVLYETLTGRQAFGGETTQDAFAAVLSHEPDWQLLPARTPPAIRSVLRRCLEKNAATRLHDMADVLTALDEGILEQGSTTSRRRRTAFEVLTGVLALTIVVYLWNPIRWVTSTSPVTPTIRRLLIGLPPTRPVARAALMPLGVGQASLAISPDGTRVAYVLEKEGVTQLYLRALDESATQPLPRTEGAFGPFFSPDARWIGFFANNRIMKIAVSRGVPIDLGAAPNPFGGSWGTNRTIVFAPDEGRRLMTVPETGGEPSEVRTKDDQGSWTRPHVLPGGKAAIVSHARGVGVLSLETGEYRMLVERGADASYAPSGHLIFARSSSLLAAPFDLERQVLTGPPVVVLEGVQTEGQRPVAQAVFSKDGTLVYAPGSASNDATRPVWVDRQGRVQPVGLPARAYRSFRLSPDGRRLAIVIGDPDDDVWVWDLDRGAPTRLTFGGTNVQPSWTPDGKRIVFTRRTAGINTAFSVPADGGGTAEPLFKSDAAGSLVSFSPDGTLVAFNRRGPDTGLDLWVRALDDPHGARPFLRTRFTEVCPMFSPDGRWIAYVSDASGRYEIYVRAFPESGRMWQISTQGGEEPVWSHDGTELFYRNGKKWMVVGVRSNPEFHAGAPQLLLEGPYVNVGGLSYDVTPDDKRLLLLEPVRQDPITYLNVVLNWFDEVKRKAGPATAR